MKKKMYVLILAVLLVSSLLCACGSSDAEETTIPDIMLSTEPAETAAPTTEPTEETEPTETTAPEETTEPSTEPTEAETEPAETTAQHSHSYTSTVVAPTCTTDGYTLHKCKSCGYSYKSNTGAAYGHTFVYEIHDATTTDYGYVLHICKDCDYTFKDNYTPPISTTEHTHSYAATVTAPTCHEQGYTTYICMTCGDSYKNNYTDTMEHNEVYTRTVAPTCENYGFDRYDCSYGCGFENAHNQVPATGHSWGEWTVTKAATTESDGTETRTCETCGATETQILTQLVEVHTHSYTAKVTTPTCTEDGYTTYTCGCGSEYTDDYLPASEHDYTVIYHEPTCTFCSCTQYTCKVCGFEYFHNNATEDTPAYNDSLGHDYIVTTIAATTESEGYDLHTCQRCGESYTDNFTAKLPAETVPPITEHIHDYDSCTTLATCTTDGYTIYTCKTCSDSYTGDITSAIGHIWGDWVRTKEPSITEYGEEIRSCTCGETESREVEKLAESHTHSYTEDVINPTCTTGGYITFTCACGDSYTGSETDAAGHSWGDWEITVEATTESEGTKVRTCSICGETESQQIDKKAPAATSDNIYDLVNAARAENGLSPLTYYAEGQQAADIRVAEIAQYFSHTRPDGSDCFTIQNELGLSMFLCGENIAVGYQTNSAVMNGWMNSPGHRANILSGYFTHIAVATDGCYWVMLFFAG